jgi:Flp pilus assembly protein TadB
MEHGYIILSIIALLFICMYGFAYSSIALDKRRQRKAAKLEVEREAIRKAENAKKQAVRDQKLQESMKRRDEIQEELKRLERIKLEQAKKQVAS